VAELTDLIVDFYNSLFEKIFFTPFSPRIADRRRRDAVRRQVEEAAGALSVAGAFLRRPTAHGSRS
jgi:hypothetical protein